MSGEIHGSGFVGAVLTVLLCMSLQAIAGEDEAAQRAAILKKISELHWQNGEVSLPNNIATLKLPAELKYLGPEDSDFILQLWGNPPDPDTLGMLFAADASPVGRNTWGVIITYDESGYIKDDDAEKIDYKDLLKQMQAEAREANPERQKQGFEPVELVGWAEPPTYNKESHKMYWAKELRFGGSDETLNYFIRILGRRGVLNMNVVADMRQLPEVKQNLPQLLAAVDFTNGNRYEDFQPGSDKMAAYGLAALVAGGVAAKAGLFKGLIAFVIAFKKLLIVAVIGIAAAISKFMNRIKAKN